MGIKYENHKKVSDTRIGILVMSLLTNFGVTQLIRVTQGMDAPGGPASMAGNALNAPTGRGAYLLAASNSIDAYKNQANATVSGDADDEIATAIASGYSHILVAPGNYTVCFANPLTFNVANQTFEGVDRDATIFTVKASSTAIHYFYATAANVKFKNFTIDGNRSNVTRLGVEKQQDGIAYSVNGTYGLCQNVVSQNLQGQGFFTYGANATFTNDRSYNTYDSSFQSNADNVTFLNCSGDLVTNIGASIEYEGGHTGNSTIGGVFTRGIQGLRVNTAYNSSFTGVTVSATTSYFADVEVGSTNITFSSNTFFDCAHGAWFHGTSGTHLTQVNFIGNSVDNITADHCVLSSYVDFFKYDNNNFSTINKAGIFIEVGLRGSASSNTVLDYSLVGAGQYAGLHFGGSVTYGTYQNNEISSPSLIPYSGIAETESNDDYNNLSGNTVDYPVVILGLHSRVKENPGFNPIGHFANPFNATNTSIGMGGVSGGPVSGTTYTVKGCDILLYASGAGLTYLDIYDQAGTQIGEPSSVIWQFLPAGNKVKFTFSGTPIFVVAGN